ncbi:formimidoylglutamase [Exilibacterium tricleocarpae]|uniref:Formimidoylglutamase n=1 Tax=Exilibacterium tricleocarpae TaxID=2591008 RepID=A0A545TNT6_9GAMM|nr:formimidoylglutamase [Exilibacterium tricleocarpae]TQV78885.1 formimidoylglutamase [Exilibacterium tricleocarpae]
MFEPPTMTLWQGRADTGESAPVWRWHQRVEAWDRQQPATPGMALVGFACDEGVRRNGGRVGARQGPAAIRRALANLAWHGETRCFDAGDIICSDRGLESAQDELAAHLSGLLHRRLVPVVLGGGHEIAWGSFQGLAGAVAAGAEVAPTIGVINFDAHFDLRNPAPGASSGTPFRQIAHWCERQGCDFHYLVLGINPSANTQALFQFAEANQVRWRTDIDCRAGADVAVYRELEQFVAPLDYLYVTVCLDVFSACYAPGVSAPAAVGIEPAWVIAAVRALKNLCREHAVGWLMADIAELNPCFDSDDRTAKLAARLVHEIVCDVSV